ncbi:MAG: hypothetical protein AAF713_10140 [Pseudomonadota bacterium]
MTIAIDTAAETACTETATATVIPFPIDRVRRPLLPVGSVDTAAMAAASAMLSATVEAAADPKATSAVVDLAAERLARDAKRRDARIDALTDVLEWALPHSDATIIACFEDCQGQDPQPPSAPAETGCQIVDLAQWRAQRR